MSTPNIKLTYFQAEGRAEKIRLAFVLGKIAFEDNRIAGEQWPTVKAQAKFGQVPLIEIDGVQYAQSSALLRYAGRVAGLYPQDPLEALRVDEVIGLTEDVGASFGGQYAIRGNSSLTEEQKKEQLQAFFDKVAAETLPKFLGFFDKVAAANTTGSGFLVGTSVTLADVVVYAQFRPVMEGQVPVSKTIFDAHPALTAHYAKISAIPEVQAWYSKTH